MRRGLAALLLGLSLIVASLSWAGFTLSRTVLDPGASERLADQLLDDEAVRDALTVRLADSLEEQLPSEVPIPREVVEGAAETALDDPRVEEVIRDGFVQSHQNALAGVDEPVTIETTGVSEAGRDALVEINPILERLLPQSPPIAVELPTTGMAWIGSVKDFVDRYTIIGAFLATIGALVALLIAKKRAPVFRRVAYWAFGAAAFWLFIGYAVPWLLDLVSPTSSAFASSLVRIFFAEMMRPAITMAIFGVVMFVTSLIWPAFERKKGARKLQPKQSVIADLRTSPIDVPTSPPVKPATGRPHGRVSEVVPMAETKAGWMSKEQEIPGRSATADLLAHEDAVRAQRQSSVPSTTTKVAGSGSENVGPERTAVMPTPSSIETAKAAEPTGSDKLAAPDKRAVSGEPTMSDKPVEETVETRKPSPKWVEGRGYDDDARISPFIDPTKPIEDIDLSDRP